MKRQWDSSGTVFRRTGGGGPARPIPALSIAKGGRGFWKHRPQNNKENNTSEQKSSPPTRTITKKCCHEEFRKDLKLFCITRNVRMQM